MCQLTRCFCFSLRQGSLIIGYMGLVSCCIFIAVSIYYIAICVVPSCDQPPADDVPYIIAISALMIILSGIAFVVNLYMLIGIKRENPNYMRPWLCCGMINYIVKGVWNFIFLVMAFWNPEQLPNVLSSICIMAVNFYLYLCVRSLYKEMKSSLTSRPLRLRRLSNRDSLDIS